MWSSGHKRTPERSERPLGLGVSTTTPPQGKRLILLGDEDTFTALFRLCVEPDEGVLDLAVRVRLNRSLVDFQTVFRRLADRLENEKNQDKEQCQTENDHQGARIHQVGTAGRNLCRERAGVIHRLKVLDDHLSFSNDRQLI